MDAQDVLDQYHPTGQLPIVPHTVAVRAGITLVPDANMPDGVCVQLDVQSGHPTLRYSTRESDTRQRFSVAHALGHYFLGHLANSEASFCDGPQQFSMSAMLLRPKETAANRFAAELLVPMDALNDVIFRQRVNDGYDLALKFGVSTNVIDMRVMEWQKIRSRYLSRLR